MLYRLFNGNIHSFQHGDQVPDLRYYGQVVLCIDPSKTNCAMVIGDPGGEVISIVECSGNNWGTGKPQDTTVFCSELKEFISSYLSNVEMVAIGLEKAITKKGMEHHHSNMVLTEIRGALLNLFLEKWGFRTQDVEVNNWSWKRYVLPEGYRSQSEKGSIRYFSEYLGDKSYIYYHEADVTDCLCIYQYVIRDMRNTYRIACTRAEKSSKKYMIGIMPADANVKFREFDFNPSFSVEENVAFFANRSLKHGQALVDIGRLTLDDIYKHALGFSSIPPHGKVKLSVVLC